MTHKCTRTHKQNMGGYVLRARAYVNVLTPFLCFFLLVSL